MNKHYTASVTDVRSIGASSPGGGSTVVGKATVMSRSPGKAYHEALKLADRRATAKEVSHPHGNYFVSVLLLIEVIDPSGKKVLDASI
jgi:hypothetical protein